MFMRSPLVITITIFFALSCFDCFPSDEKRIVINVDHFGARGDGRTDDSKAFSRAWEKFCETEKGELLIPPTKTYLLKPVSLDGPCKPNLKMKISGTIKASPNKRDYDATGRLNWMLLRYLDYFNVDGDGNKGTIDGSGENWWKDSCNFKETPTCDKGLVPFSVMFENCTNLKVENLLFKNAQKMHLTFNVTRNVEASHINIQAPQKSPNTDGIHVSRSYNVTITNSNIATGDDCISIVNKTTRVRVLDTQCGPGHGISIGSLGRLGNTVVEHVSDVVVKRVKFIGTTNGVRIKTWQVLVVPGSDVAECDANLDEGGPQPQMHFWTYLDDLDTDFGTGLDWLSLCLTGI